MSHSKPLGRPPIENPKSIKLTVRIDRESADILDAFCQGAGIKRRVDGVRAAIQLLKKYRE